MTVKLQIFWGNFTSDSGTMESKRIVKVICSKISCRSSIKVSGTTSHNSKLHREGTFSKFHGSPSKNC